jgi:hypothetical protein
MEVVPLSQFFVFTEGARQEFSAVEWLERVDSVVLERIIESSELFFDLGEHEEEAPFECLDYLTLSYMVGEKECQEDSANFTEETKQNCLIGLATFAQCEKLRREGILTFTGNGKVSEFDKNKTDIKLTEMGKVVGSSIRTMLQISDAIEKDEKSS